MHGNSADRRALEREALRNVINQWNANRLDLFELSEPNEDLEFHGVMRFYFQDSGQKVATKCIRVASDATVEDVIGTLVEKFRPDMRMLSVPSYALYELHEGCPERRMLPDEKPLLVQLNWHVDDREGRFLLRNIDDKGVNSSEIDSSNASFRRKLSKREKKQLKKQEKLSRMKSENGDVNDKQTDGVAEKLYTELPETSFTRSISNPEAVMRRRRQQKLERKLQQFRSKDGGPDTGGTLKIYGEALCKDVPYKTLLLSVRDCAGAVVREMLDKYGLTKTDPGQWCLVQVTQQNGIPDTEYVLDDDECPLSILMNSPNTGSIMFHVRRRPADCAPRKRKKKPGTLGTNTTNPRDRDVRALDSVPILVELELNGRAPHPGDTAHTIRLTDEVMEVGSANGIALQLYGPHIQPRHCVITNADGVTSLTPCHADAHTYVNGVRIHQTTILSHGSLVKFGHSNTYKFLDPAQEDRTRHPAAMLDNARIYDSRSPRALSPTEPSRENIETTFDLEGNVETISTASGAREDNRSLGSSSENRLGGMERYPRGQDPILPAVLEFPEEPQEQFLARVITHLDVATPTFRLAPAYTLYLCARYRASTHYRPELTPTERAHKLTLLLQHAAMLIRHTIQDRSTESNSQAFWLANASELLHFLKSDRHVSAFSLQAQDTLADGVQLAFKNLVACLTDKLNTSAMMYLLSVTGDDNPREVIDVLCDAMVLLRRCRVNAALTIQLFSQLFHWISAKALSNVICNSNLCTRKFGNKLYNRLRNLQVWAESQGLELAAECHLAKIVQCAHLMQAPKYTPEELANLSSACFKLNSLQLGALLMQYKPEPGEKLASPAMLEQAAKAAESVADELARAEGREVTLHEDPAPPLQLLLPDDGFSCDVVQGVPPGLADFLHPLQASGLCRLAAQPTSSGHWTVYMSAPRPASALSTTQPEVQVIRLHKAGGGMGLSIVAARGAGQERLGIYIKSVVPGGAADRDGRLAAGDQLLSVDGQSLLGITQEKAAEFLVRTGSVVTLEVAKGGAVYHGLATLLQQPSPPPNRAWDYDYYDSQESLYGMSNQRLFTPPATKPKNQVFFNSDDNLYKKESRKFTIPRIEIETDEPTFNLQVTDFSDPSPRSVSLTYDETGTGFLPKHVELEEIEIRSWKEDFLQKKSFSIDVENPYDEDETISETDKFLSIRKHHPQTKLPCSTSLQDISSSTSSINTCIHDSNLDLSQFDTPQKQKNWKSPDEIRQGQSSDDGKLNEDKAISDPELNRRITHEMDRRSKSVSEEKLDYNDKLTEYERLEILKLLRDWSVNGSDSKSEFDSNIIRQNTNDQRCLGVKYHSEPNLSPKTRARLDDNMVFITKFKSDDNFVTTQTNIDNSFTHQCEFRNCIFNEQYKAPINNGSNTKVLKSILKNSKENLNVKECLTSQFNLDKLQDDNDDKLNERRRHSESVLLPETFDTNKLLRCDSLERLTTNHLYRKKFPDGYIVRKSNKTNGCCSPKKIIILKRRTWKSCSDIKPTTKRTVRKCCRYAKKNCPITKCNGREECARKTQSCIDVHSDNAARLAALQDIPVCDRQRRMSERDLPSRVDSERTIPSSKSVPALHHISPNSEQPNNKHDVVFNPGYSRTSSNNSINTNGGPPPNGGNNPATGMRSRSTHNLLQQQQQAQQQQQQQQQQIQQQDGGFYQNLSVYRNKVPSPQHLGDRTSNLRSSQNSLQSSVANSQRPTSAYYPPPVVSNSTTASRSNLHQSIPNLKSPPPSMHRLHIEDNRSSSYPSVHQHPSQPQQPPSQQPYSGNSNYPPNMNYPNHYQQYPSHTMSSTNSYTNQNNLQYVNTNHNQQPQHLHNGQRSMEETRYNGNNGLLREDVFRQSQNSEMRYPTNNGNIRMSEMQTRAMMQQQQQQDERYTEMRPSKSDDLLKQHATNQHEMMRYASSGNIRAHESSKVELPQLRQNIEHNNHLRGQAKMAEMSEEVRRRQTRLVAQQNYQSQPPYQQAPPSASYYQSHQQPQYYQQQPQQQYANSPPQLAMQMMQNTQSMQNLNLNYQPPYQQQPQQQYYPPPPSSSNSSYKSPPIAPKPGKKSEDLPELPPVNTHPLYSASTQDPPKMAFYPTVSASSVSTKTPRDPWAREEQERQAEARREASRQWQEQQIRELMSLPHRTPQQDEQLRVLQLEREFQRRAMEAAEQDDEDTEKESPSPSLSQTMPNTNVPPSKPSPPSVAAKQETIPASILKAGQQPQLINQQQPPLPQQQHQPQLSQVSPPEPVAPPPPERGSSFAVMSMRAKENIKRVSFNDNTSPTINPPNNLQIDETIREDPNSFIRQAETMLASPTSPTDPSTSGVLTATPGVIGAQEVYRDPRARRLAEQAQQKNQTMPAVPEKLSFKEKMKMFAMETGEQETPKDKSKISRAQREIDNLGSPNMVH